MSRLPVKKTYKLFVGGEFPRSESGRTYEAEGQNVARGSRKDLRDAVRAARGAFPKWAGMTAYNRGQVLYRVAEMLQARDRGLLLTDEADFQLHMIYLWYEKQTSDALALLEQLDARHPHNPLFLQRKAEAHAVYAHDYMESVAAWRALLSRADAGAVHAPDLTTIRARLGLASAFTAMNLRRDAIDQLQRVLDMQPATPAWARERAERELRTARARTAP